MRALPFDLCVPDKAVRKMPGRRRVGPIRLRRNKIPYPGDDGAVSEVFAG